MIYFNVNKHMYVTTFALWYRNETKYSYIFLFESSFGGIFVMLLDKIGAT